MARRFTYRSSVLTGIGATGVQTIPSTFFKRPGKNANLVGCTLVFRGTTDSVGNINDIKFLTDEAPFYDRLVLHDRQWKERFAASMIPEATTSGIAAGAFVGVGSYTCWFNDPRPSNPDLQDRYSAPRADISCEINYGSAPTAGRIDLILHWSTVQSEFISRQTKVVLNMGASADGATRNIEESGRILAYGLPFLSLTDAAAFRRARIVLSGTEIANINSIAGALGTETDQTIYAESGSITDPAATSVIWKSVRGNELPGGKDSDSFVEFDVGTSAMTNTVMPFWAYLPQPNATQVAVG